MPVIAVDPPPSRRSPRSLERLIAESGLRSLVIGVSKDPHAKLTILLIDPVNGRPRLVAKVPTNRLSAAVLEAELELLEALPELVPGRMGCTIPQLVGRFELHGRPAMVTEALPGSPMTAAYLRRGHTSSHERVARDFSAASGWLAELQHRTAGARAPIDLDAGVTSALRSRFGRDERLDRDLARLREIHLGLRAEAIPRTAVHGDFWPGNILLGSQGVSGVVDWEAGATSGEPVRDIVRFPLMYALYLDRWTRHGRNVRGHHGLVRGRWGAPVDYALDGRGWFPELFRRFIRHGLGRLGASPELWRDAALAGVAEIAALTDDPEFAGRHLELFRRLRDRPPVERKPA